MKLFVVFGLLIVFCFSQATYAREDKGVLLAKIESMRNEVQASINDLRSIKRNFLIDLKYLLTNDIKTDAMHRIDSAIKKTLYRIKKAIKTGYVECYQSSHVSSIENSNLPVKNNLNKCWQSDMESVHTGPVYEADEIEIKPTKSENTEKCYDEAESSIEQLLSLTHLDLTKCTHKSLETALNFTSRAEDLIKGTGNMVIDRISTIQQEYQTADDEKTENNILHRINNIDQYVKRLKELTKNVLDERKAIGSQAIIDANSCSERPVGDMHKIVSDIERMADMCIRSL